MCFFTFGDVEGDKFVGLDVVDQGGHGLVRCHFLSSCALQEIDRKWADTWSAFTRQEWCNAVKVRSSSSTSSHVFIFSSSCSSVSSCSSASSTAASPSEFTFNWLVRKNQTGLTHTLIWAFHHLGSPGCSARAPVWLKLWPRSRSWSWSWSGLGRSSCSGLVFRGSPSCSWWGFFPVTLTDWESADLASAGHNHLRKWENQSGLRIKQLSIRISQNKRQDTEQLSWRSD